MMTTTTPDTTLLVDPMVVRQEEHHAIRKSWFDFRTGNVRLSAEYKHGEAITFSVVAFTSTFNAPFSATLGTHTASVWASALCDGEGWRAGIHHDADGYTVINDHAVIRVPDAIIGQMREFASEMDHNEG